MPTEPLLGFDLGRENREFITPVRCINTFLRNILPFIRLFLVFITNGNILLGGGKALLGGGKDVFTGGRALLGGGKDVFTGGRALLGGGNELMKQLSMPESAWQNSKMSPMKDICQKLDAQVVIAIQWNIWSRIKSPTEGR